MPVVHSPASAASGVRGPRISVLMLALGAALGGGLVCAPVDSRPATSAAHAAAPLDIPYERFILPNGLTVLVHEDHKAPIVSVAVWYHVGSKDEPAGKTGFAHLFEHLMFNGSENHKGEYFEPFEKAGVSGQNGTTWL